MSINFKKILTILNPQPPIGGLEISDSELRLIFIKGDKLISASAELPTGIVEEGKIKNREDFKTTLSNLRSQITPRLKKKICVIVNIPDLNIYVQVFNLPMVAAENLEETAKLNLQMISPTDFASVYSDWQKVGETNIDGGQIEILGAFAPSQVIDEFINCLRETNFVVAAIEFSSLAISRLSSGLKNQVEAYLLLRLDSSGLSFNLIRNHNLYFNRFVPWPVGVGVGAGAGKERQISLNDLKEMIVKETQKVLNFFSSHWPGAQLNNLLLVAPALEEKISQIITENLPLSVQKLALPGELTASDGQWSITSNQLQSLPSDWFSALGSSLRGLIPRSKDIIISLASTGTEEEFRQQQIINFAKIWRNIALTSLAFILVAFIGVEGFLIKTTSSLNKQLANLANIPELGTLTKLQDEAKNFNTKIDLALQAQSQITDWSPFFEKFRELASSTIVIERIAIQSLEMPIFFSGRAVDEKAILDLKNTLEKDPQFQNVNLPLASITPASDGSLRFSITFKVKDFVQKSEP